VERYGPLDQFLGAAAGPPTLRWLDEILINGRQHGATPGRSDETRSVPSRPSRTFRWRTVLSRAAMNGSRLSGNGRYCETHASHRHRNPSTTRSRARVRGMLHRNGQVPLW